MGAYLSEPVRDKASESGADEHVAYSAVAMQGWRVNQEDAHNCALKLADGYSLFAVYDGHGGPEVSQYVAEHLPPFLADTLRAGHAEHCGAKCGCGERMTPALQKAFLQFDERLRSADVLKQLAELAGKKDEEKSTEDEAEERCLLLEEAALPLEKLLLHNYGLHLAVGPGKLKKKKSKDKVGKFISPRLKGRKKGRRVAQAQGAEPKENLVAKLAADMEDGEAEPRTPPPTPSQSAEEAGGNGNKKRKQADRGPEPPAAKCAAEPSSKLAKTEGGEPQPSDVLNGKAEADDANAKLCEDGVKCDALPVTAAEATSPTIGGRVRQRASKSESDADGSAKGAASPSPRAASVADDAAAAAAAVGANGPRNTESPDTATAPPSSGEDEEKAAADGGGGASVPAKQQEDAADESEDDDDFVMEDAEEGTSSSDDDEGDDKSDGAPQQQATAAAGGSHRGKKKRSLLHPNCDEAAAGGGDHQAVSPGAQSDSGTDDDEDDASAAASSSDDDEADEDEDEELDSSLEEDEVPSDEHECEQHANVDMFGGDDEDFDMPSGDTPGVDSGTTACVALMHSDKHIFVANIGDSRAVVGSAGGSVPVDLSADHKPEDETELRRIRAAGGKVTADGRVNGGLNLSRAFGDHFYKRTDDKPLEEQMISALPDVTHYELSPADRFLLIACDGIWNSLSSEEAVRFVNERLDKSVALDDICKQLCDACLAEDTSGDGTGCDNMTVVLVAFNAFVPPPAVPNGGGATGGGDEPQVDGVQTNGHDCL